MLALFCGYPPVCDRCGVEDAKLSAELPIYGKRQLCERCVVELLQIGLRQNSEQSEWAVLHNRHGG